MLKKGREELGCQVIVLRDLNAREGNEEVLSVIGKYGVPRRNDSGEVARVVL